VQPRFPDALVNMGSNRPCGDHCLGDRCTICTFKASIGDGAGGGGGISLESICIRNTFDASRMCRLRMRVKYWDCGEHSDRWR